ncbi:MAG: hypothetical protein N2595_08865, partial [bacterium]|nr:hypothetical protein [bacterium]
NTHTVEAFDELEVRTEKFMILDFNPTAEFWLTERFRQMGLSLRAHEIVTTYRDNPYLPASQVRSIERRRGIADWWRVYGEGRYGEPTGVAWYNWEVGHVEERGEHILGVDFGQGSSPTAIVAVRREDGERFTAWELAYGNLSLREIADILLLRARVTPDVLIVGDSAQRDEINFLRRDGVPIVPCRKYTLAASFHLLNNVSVRISARSENLLREARSLQWADRGRGLLAAGQPDHAVDAVRYCMHEML